MADPLPNMAVLALHSVPHFFTPNNMLPVSRSRSEIFVKQDDLLLIYFWKIPCYYKKLILQYVPANPLQDDAIVQGAEWLQWGFQASASAGSTRLVALLQGASVMTLDRRFNQRNGGFSKWGYTYY